MQLFNKKFNIQLGLDCILVCCLKLNLSYASYFFWRKPYVPRDKPIYTHTSHRRLDYGPIRNNLMPKSEAHQDEPQVDKTVVIYSIKPTTPPRSVKLQSALARQNVQCQQCDYACKYPYIMKKHLIKCF